MTQSTVTTAALGAGSMPPERTLYSASGGRKTMLSFAFLILLPFFVSLPIMLWQRLSQGVWEGTLALAILGVIFLVLMSLLIIELTVSLWSRVELGEDKVKLRLPASRRGPTPFLRYQSHDIPYDQIAAVEVRREIFGGSVAPVMMKGARLKTKDNKIIPLGFVSEADVDSAFPFPDIAHQIAARAGVPVKQEGSVWKKVRLPSGVPVVGYNPMASLAADLDGGQSSKTLLQQITDEDIGRLNTAHRRIVMALVNVLVTLVAVGIVLDFMAESDANRASELAIKASVLAPIAAPAAPKKPAR